MVHTTGQKPSVKDFVRYFLTCGFCCSDSRDIVGGEKTNSSVLVQQTDKLVDQGHFPSPHKLTSFYKKGSLPRRVVSCSSFNTSQASLSIVLGCPFSVVTGSTLIQPVHESWYTCTSRTNARQPPLVPNHWSFGSIRWNKEVGMLMVIRMMTTKMEVVSFMNENREDNVQ